MESFKIFRKKTSRERPKSAPHLRLKIEKGDPSGFVKLQLVAKNEKNKGETLWGHEKIFEKKSHKAEKREESHSAEKVRNFCFGILVKN